MELIQETRPEAVMTAGGILTETYANGDGSTSLYIWLVRNRESVLAHAEDPDVPITYQVPKGHIEPGELPSQTAEREVREEIGIVAVASDWLGEIVRSAQEYGDDGQTRPVVKVIAMYAMRHVQFAQLPDTQEQPELVRVDEFLASQMYYPEEAAFLAELFPLQTSPYATV